MAGPSRVEWMQTKIHVPVAASWWTTACSPSHRRSRSSNTVRTLLLAERPPKPAQPFVQHRVRDASESRAKPRPRSPNPSPGATATRCVVEQALGGDALRKREPDEERAFAARTRERGDDAVAPCFVERTPLRDRLLRAGQRCDRGVLQRDEDPGSGCAPAASSAVRRSPRSRGRSRAASRPCRSSSRSRRARRRPRGRPRLGEEARRRPAVEDEVAVGEVVQTIAAPVCSAKATASAKTPAGAATAPDSRGSSGRRRRLVPVARSRSRAVRPRRAAARRARRRRARRRRCSRDSRDRAAGSGRPDSRGRVRARRARSSSRARTRPRARGSSSTP